MSLSTLRINAEDAVEYATITSTTSRNVWQHAVPYLADSISKMQEEGTAKQNK
jgi:hypothetical protein